MVARKPTAGKRARSNNRSASKRATVTQRPEADNTAPPSGDDSTRKLSRIPTVVDTNARDYLDALEDDLGPAQIGDFTQGYLRLLIEGLAWESGVSQEVVNNHLHNLRERLKKSGYRAESLRDYRKMWTALTGAPRETSGQSTYLAITGAGPDDPRDPEQVGMFQLAGTERLRLASFCLFIDRHIHIKDELFSTTIFEGRIVSGDQSLPFRVDAQVYATDKLLAAIYETAGPSVQIMCRPAELRNAIAAISTPVIEEKTCDFGLTADKTMFLAQAGFVTAEGYSPYEEGGPARVDLKGEERAQHLDLVPLEPRALNRVKHHIVKDLLQVHDESVTLVLLAVVALAILHPFAEGGKFVLWMTGLTGSGKTFLAKLFQSFFGRWPADGGMASWASTGNYLERVGYFFRNALYVIDDFKPSVTAPMPVIKLIQAYADATSRGRLQRDATTNVTRWVRGWLVITGEDVVEHTASALARSVVLHVPNRAKDIARGARCLHESARYSGVTVDLIAWLLKGGRTKQFADRVKCLRERYYQDIAGQQNDSRIASNFALLGAAGELFLEYLADIWPEAPAVAKRFVEKDLVVLRDFMLREAAEEQESKVFLRILADLHTLGAVKIKGITGPPGRDFGPLIGKTEAPQAASRDATLRAKAHLRLSIRACLEHVNKSLISQGKTPLRITEKALLRQLLQDGLLLDERGNPIRSDATESTLTGVGRVQNQVVHLFRIASCVLTGEAPLPESSLTDAEGDGADQDPAGPHGRQRVVPRPRRGEAAAASLTGEAAEAKSRRRATPGKANAPSSKTLRPASSRNAKRNTK